MALILNIDTATEIAGISLTKDGENLFLSENREQKNHASWLHSAIEEMMRKSGFSMSDLHAVAVASGPGSYTGLRVGMAAAKGFCYALGIPLIAENTLKVMALAARDFVPVTDLLCPMIDARRMEVFTAVYNHELAELLAPVAMIIDENSFSDYLADHRLTFFGGGSNKCKPLLTNARATYIEIKKQVGYLGILSFSRYLTQEFTELAYSEPAYTKEFYTHSRK
jgi:tRNA threonylcarbamoyladenosine biosynthesis protein TsaB